MKKYCVSIFTVLCSLPAMASVTVVGRVLDERGAPLTGAFVMDPNMSGVGGYVESDGTIPSDIPFSDNITSLQISMLGYETQTVAVNPNNPNIGSIRMQPDTEVLEASVTTACQFTTGSDKLYREINSDKCYPYACRDAQYEPSGNSVAWYTGGNSICIGSAASGGPCANFCAGGNCQSITVYDSCDYVIGKECTPTNSTGFSSAFYTWRNNTRTCEIQSCDPGYRHNTTNNTCEYQIGQNCLSELRGNHHAKTATWQLDKSDNIVCKISACENNRYQYDKASNKCIDQQGEPCTPENTSHVKEAKYAYDASSDTLRCEITECTKEYLPSDDGQTCEKSEGKCTDAQLAEIEHATAGELKRGKCHPTDCEDGFEPDGKQCVEISGKCDPMPENARQAHREYDAASGTEICIIDKCKSDYVLSPDKMSCAKPQLSKEDAQKQIDELQQNADAMREREQSLANRMTGGIAIGATGIGGMQIGAALAEQSADDAAERDMAAYLATFRCDYGSGLNIQGGETNIQLPGANTLLPLYNEYTTLAADLKTRKEALGMAPGIESEVILDAATSGLYDNESLGITDGVYTSISRALMAPDGTDASEWAAQRADTQQQLKTGAIVAGAGALVGVAGNVLTNYVGKNQPKESSDEITAKYDSKRTLLFQNLRPVQEESLRKAIAVAPVVEEDKEQDTSSPIVPNPDNLFETTISDWQSACTQQGGTWDAENIDCECPGNAWWNLLDGKCIEIEISAINLNIGTSVLPKLPIAVFFADSLFDSGKTTLKSTTEMDKTIQELRTATSGETNFKLLIVGYTDTDRILTWKDICTKDKICDNNALGRARAQTVADYIKSQWPELPANTITVDTAGEKCAKRTTDAKQKALYRKVAIYVAFNGEALPTSAEYCSSSQSAQ